MLKIDETGRIHVLAADPAREGLSDPGYLELILDEGAEGEEARYVVHWLDRNSGEETDDGDGLESARIGTNGQLLIDLTPWDPWGNRGGEVPDLSPVGFDPISAEAAQSKLTELRALIAKR